MSEGKWQNNPNHSLAKAHAKSQRSLYFTFIDSLNRSTENFRKVSTRNNPQRKDANGKFRRSDKSLCPEQMCYRCQSA